eukprot:921731-Amorphochlora_amoeboformis.AAC.1
MGALFPLTESRMGLEMEHKLLKLARRGFEICLWRECVWAIFGLCIMFGGERLLHLGPNTLNAFILRARLRETGWCDVLHGTLTADSLTSTTALGTLETWWIWPGHLAEEI